VPDGKARTFDDPPKLTSQLLTQQQSPQPKKLDWDSDSDDLTEPGIQGNPLQQHREYSLLPTKSQLMGGGDPTQNQDNWNSLSGSPPTVQLSPRQQPNSNDSSTPNTEPSSTLVAPNVIYWELPTVHPAERVAKIPPSRNDNQVFDFSQEENVPLKESSYDVLPRKPGDISSIPASTPLSNGTQVTKFGVAFWEPDGTKLENSYMSALNDPKGYQVTKTSSADNIAELDTPFDDF